MENQFSKTKRLFAEYINYKKPLTYDDWMKLPDNHKAAALFIQFYSNIVLAWSKIRCDYISDEDYLSIEIQYLIKNVEKIRKDSKRYTQPYIYTISYTAMVHLNFVQKSKDKYEKEISNEVLTKNGAVLDLFNTRCVTPDFEKILITEEFWNVIENMGLETNKVINHLLNGEELTKVSKRAKRYKTDPLRDVEVSEDKEKEIIEELKIQLAPYKKYLID